jgi:SAM-dependent methyltransferase
VRCRGGGDNVEPVASFDQLAAEALAAPFSGWDFSWLHGRSRTLPLPWDYRAVLAEHAARADAMLDIGTGGGEFLARLQPRPRRTVATEGWPPNVGVAAARLRPLGIPVIQYEGAPGNDEQGADEPASDEPDHPAPDAAKSGGPRCHPGHPDQHLGSLPFRDGAFPLVANRHESFCAAEVARVLAPGGTFVTQQVDPDGYGDFYALLGIEPPASAESWLPLARRQVERAGLVISTAQTADEQQQFDDVGALVYYLRVIYWAVPEYRFDRYRDRLRELHDTPAAWPAIIRQPRFLLVAAKPERP